MQTEDRQTRNWTVVLLLQNTNAILHTYIHTYIHTLITPWIISTNTVTLNSKHIIDINTELATQRTKVLWLDIMSKTRCLSLLLYDYKVELTAVGSRSQINADDNTVTLLFCIVYFSFVQAGHRGSCLRPLHILAFLSYVYRQKSNIAYSVTWKRCMKAITDNGSKTLAPQTSSLRQIKEMFC